MRKLISRVRLAFAVWLAVAGVMVRADASRDENNIRPNILLCIADDWSFGHAGGYGCDWVRTPGFDRVAKSGLLFNRAYTPNAKCAPSRACLLTGRNSWQLKEAANHICEFPFEFTTYVEALKAHGYLVGTTGKGWGPGNARAADGSPRQMTGQPFNKRKLRPPTAAINRNDYSSNFVDFLDTVDSKKPWAFWYGALEPHRGYQFGSGIKLTGKKPSDVDRVPAFWPDNETTRTDMLDYAFEVQHFDSHVAKMLNELEERGALDNTIIIVTSDHGMPFPRCKGQAYDPSNHIPLAIMWGKNITNPGRIIEDYVSLIDIAPTLLELAGLDWITSNMKPSPGRSLTDIIRSDKNGQVTSYRDHVLIGKERHDIGRPDDVGYPIRGIIQDNILYIQNHKNNRWPAGNPRAGYPNCDASPTKSLILNSRRQGSNPEHWELCFGVRADEEIYDLTTDPDCVKNLSSDSAHQKLKRALMNQMTAELKLQKDPRMFGKGDQFDKMRYVNDSTRDFYNRVVLKAETVRAGWINESDKETSFIDKPEP